MPEALVVGLPEADDGGFAKRGRHRRAGGDGRQRRCRTRRQAFRHVQTHGRRPARKRCRAGAGRRVAARAGAAAARAHSTHPSAQCRRTRSTARLRRAEIDDDPVGCGRRAAELYGSIVLVKGVESHVVAPDGDAWTYQGGAPGLACRAAATCSRGSSADCWRAGQSRSARCCGRCGSTAKPARGSAVGRADRLPRPPDRRRNPRSTAALSPCSRCSGRARRRSAAPRAARWSTRRCRTESRPSR